MDKEKVVMYVILGVVVIALIFVVSSVVSSKTPKNTQENFNRFVADEQEDICATPPGYTEEAWREHMGHHPDRYKDCL